MTGPGHQRDAVALRRIVVGVLDTNCWAVHAADARQALLVDPGAEPDQILAAVADLDVVGIVITHAHFDHVLALPAVAAALDAPVLGHAAEPAVWQHELDYLAANGHFDAGLATEQLLAAGLPPRPSAGGSLWSGQLDERLTDGAQIAVGPLTVQVLHTPGHTPGGLCLAMAGHVLTGDTLFPGGPGLTGWPLSDFPTIISSVHRLMAELPDGTVVHPGHGPDATIGTERSAVPEWERRGW